MSTPSSLQLVSHPVCPYVHRAATMLHEKGVPFERRSVDLRAKPDWFLAISPRGKVPVLIADGHPLFESLAILEFLDETHPPRVMPEDPYERARQRAWVEVANDLFAAQHRMLSIKTRDELGAAREAFTSLLARFEQGVRGEYFGGDAVGIVDFAVAPTMLRVRLLERWSGIELVPRSPIAAWVDRLATRPSVVHSVPEDFEARYRVAIGEYGVFPLEARTEPERA
ncbi:MAG TPA: glutathione S-transferase family protein [Kofleriaceae bacterium]|nr:glutathione S-transferase family protein [Kofleriaceae bacterium]